MTEPNRPAAPRHDLSNSASAGQDVTSLLDLHRRGVIDDAQFADLSRNVTRAPVLAGVSAGRSATAWRSRSTSVVAGAAVLALVAAGMSLVLLPDASVGAAPTVSTPQPAPRSSATSVPTQIPSASTAKPTSKPILTTTSASKYAVRATQAAGPAGHTATTSSSKQVAAPASHAPAVPVHKPLAAQVDCSAYELAQQSVQSQREAQLANNSIEINMALRGGDMDRAAMLQNNAIAMQAQWSLDDLRLHAQYPHC